ncbi:MAG: hypothetical protein E6612_06995, partial [Paeniclostridium sordellii]|nr:hypothetical protein [Paeniclostridium sordellii]
MKKSIKFIITIISIIIMVCLFIVGYSIYKKHEMDSLIDVTNNFFNEYAKKGEASYEEKGMKAVYTNKETEIVAGDKNEFMAMVYFDVDVNVNGEKDFTSSYHKMRIKKDNLSEIKEEIDKNEIKKNLGIYYQMTPNGLELSYNKQKDWVSVPIPNEYLISVFDFDNNKLKEN